MYVELTTLRGTEAHEAFCDAMLDSAGYVLLSDSLFRLGYARFHPSIENAWVWRMAPADYAGSA